MADLDMSRNRAMRDELTELPNGLWLLKTVGDKFVILYPADVLRAIRAAFDARLLTEKGECVDAKDAANDLREKLERRDREVDELRAELAPHRAREIAPPLAMTGGTITGKSVGPMSCNMAGCRGTCGICTPPKAKTPRSRKAVVKKR